MTHSPTEKPLLLSYPNGDNGAVQAIIDVLQQRADAHAMGEREIAETVRRLEVAGLVRVTRQESATQVVYELLDPAEAMLRSLEGGRAA